MKITYWTTSCLEPDIEAVSKEVFELAGQFSGSRIFSVSPHFLLKTFKLYKCIGFHTFFDPVLRLIIPLLEFSTDINHIYAEVSPWIFFKTLKNKPTVLTIASEKGEPIPEFIDRCNIITVQTEGMKKILNHYNIGGKKVQLIYPGIDLSFFTKKSSGLVNSERPKVLFATFPRSMEELEARGVFFLIDAAKQCPDIDFALVSRPWKQGDTGLQFVKQLLSTNHIKNLRIIEGLQDNMATLYKQHDFTIIPYTKEDGGKECPRSLIESLACGVPILISEIAPFSSFVAQNDCGCVFSPNALGLSKTLEIGLKTYARLSENSIRCAHEYFDCQKTFLKFASIYNDLYNS